MLHKQGINESSADYATIASGAPYAEYLISKYYKAKITVDAGKKLAIYIVKEVEKIDPNVGGPVKVVAITADKYHELDESEIFDIYEDVRDKDKIVNVLIIKAITGKLNVKKLKR